MKQNFSVGTIIVVVSLFFDSRTTIAFTPPTSHSTTRLNISPSLRSSQYELSTSTAPSSHFNKKQNARNDFKALSTSSLSMAVEGDFDPDAISRSVSEVKAGSIRARLRAIYKFTRPHTIRGTILASFAGTTRALIDTPGAIASANWGSMLPRAIIGMVALLLGNAFIVGINQIFDESIDKMNKPFLPVASGEMSKRFAWVAVLFSGVVGPMIV